jgi:GT2 family glycosyltransferase
MSHSPVAVLECDLARPPIVAVDGVGAFTRAQILVRVEGRPVGYVCVPVTDCRCDAGAIVREIQAHFCDRALRQIVARRLYAGRAGAAHPPQDQPSLTVAVCTRDRPADLAACLESLGRLDRRVDVLVVDNAPSDDRTRQVVSQAPVRARYVLEPRQGLSWARRRAIAESHNDLLGFVDDDVRVDAGWASAAAAPFAAEPTVTAVLGLVAPLELALEAQARFERHGGFGRGFQRRWIRRGGCSDVDLANTGTMGTGANMVFRRAVFERIGLFDTALGAGTPASGGEDLEMIFRILAGGGTVVYEPAALVWHRHRGDAAGLRNQITSWGRGMFAHLAASWRTWPEHRLAIAMLGARLLGLYYPRRILQALANPRGDVELAWAEFVGALTGPFRYRQGGRSNVTRPRPDVRPGRSSPGASITLDVSEPIPDRLECSGDPVDLNVICGTRHLGTLRIAAGGDHLSAARVIDAVVARFDPALLDPSGDARRQLDGWLRAALDRADCEGG